MLNLSFQKKTADIHLLRPTTSMYICGGEARIRLEGGLLPLLPPPLPPSAVCM